MNLSDAIDAYERGEYTRTRDLCREALTLDLSPENRALAHTYLGHALANLGDQQGANDQFSRALALEPSPRGRIHLHYEIGIGLRKMGDREGARTEFERAIAQFGEPAIEETREPYVYSLLELGFLEYEGGDYAAALICAERASHVSIPSQRQNRRILLNIEVLRGEALFRLRRWRESIPVLRKVLAQAQETDADIKALVMCLLGLALCAVGEFDEAFNVLNATELDPANEAALWAAKRVWLGNLHYLRDDYPKALEHYEAIADRPAEEWAGSRDSLARMADCYLETRRPERGLQVAEEAYREMRGNPLVHIVLAKALAIACRWEQADAILHELNEDTLEEGLRQRFYVHAAYVAAGRGDRSRADHWFRRLREQNPNSRYLGPLQDAIDRIGKRKSRFLGWFRRQD